MRKALILLIPIALLLSCKGEGTSSSSGDGRDMMIVAVSRSAGWDAGERINVNGEVSDPLTQTLEGVAAAFSVPSTGAPLYVASPYNAVFGYAGGSAHLNLAESRFPEGSARQIWLGKADGSGVCTLSPALSTLTLMGGIETYRRIKLTAIGGSAIAGAFFTDYETLTPAEAGASDCIEIRPSDDGNITLPLSISLPPGDYSAEGFRLVVTGTDGVTKEAVLLPPQSYQAGALYSMDITGSLPHPESGKIAVTRPDRAWVEGESIKVGSIRSLPIPASEAGASTATFEAEGVEAPYCVAWPAEALSAYSDERGTVVIPSGQTAGAAEPVLIGRADDAVVSLSEATCTVNIVSETITGEVSSIHIEAGGQAKIAGEFQTNFWSISGGTQTAINLTAGSSGTFTLPASIVIAPGDYRETGFTITVTAGGETTVNINPSRIYSAGEEYTISLEGALPEPDIELSCEAVTSSTLTLEWTLGESVTEDIAQPYTLTLYNDSAGTDIFREYSFPAGAACWSGKTPRFTVPVSLPGVTLFAQVTSEDHSSALVEMTTEDFDIVQMPTSISEPAVVLAEDFGELSWDFDAVSGGAGISAPSSPANYGVPGTSYVPVAESVGSYSVFTYSSALQASRLKKWARDTGSDARVRVHPGYVTLGSIGSAKGWILTPPFPVASGKKATATVTITVSKAFSSAHSDYAVGVLNNTSNSGANGGGANMQNENTSDFSWPNERPAKIYRRFSVQDTGIWKVFSFEGIELSRDDRIVVGCAPQASDGATYKDSSGSRPGLNLSDIKVEVTSVN
ncbi:MAG: hypothetical protein IKP46_03370 [Bacteroidales bacterium]|nr:hypothetical protein [Bacteroidales bacterium]